MTLLCVCACLSLLIFKSCANNAQYYTYNYSTNRTKYIILKKLCIRYICRFYFQVKTDLEQTQPRLQRIKDDPE